MAENIKIKGFDAKVEYDEASDTYIGAFKDFAGGADFYARTKSQLMTEGLLALEVFLSICEDAGLDPYKH